MRLLNIGHVFLNVIVRRFNYTCFARLLHVTCHLNLSYTHTVLDEQKRVGVINDILK